ncbi:SpvB/TcaC N-terminal domain-containing protein [Shewanella sp. SP1S1-7]|uniref:SpvB/TcaC N-terminal domain-containing protein n=1 Tax=Shewanella sp. SP1S1-7 TaxID=3063536 RepID=UPI00288D0ECE|nr:SpvB/TcaC N-terminal domain-containing protein [Shewanella sp. SP1S1-7]MDT3334964.1 SpvB/TcaC N-terminal domain-containing protein [Shewanella sp. SP1S1-7]
MVLFFTILVPSSTYAISIGGIQKNYLAEGNFSLNIVQDTTPYLSQSVSCDDKSSLSNVSSSCGTLKWFRNQVSSKNLLPGESIEGSSNILHQGILPVGDYEYRYQECHAAGACSAYSTPVKVSVKPLSLPAQLSLDTPSFSSVELKWTLPSNGDFSPQDSVVEQSLNGGSWSKVYVGNKTNILLATSQGKYDYRVKTCSFGQCSGYAYFVTLTQQESVSAGVIKQLDYKLLTDKYGNFYLKPPKKFVLLAGNINIPLFIDSDIPTLLLTDSSGVWSLYQVNSAQLNGKLLIEKSGYQLTYRDYDGDGRLDLEVRFNAVNQLPGFAILDIASPYHSILVISDIDPLEPNPEAEIKPTSVANPLEDTDNGEVVGSIPAELKVTPMGTASYSVPIEQGPGSAGITPNLSLQYDSSQGNGWLGMGWSINGVSVISRCSQNKEQDGQALAVNFSNTDRFCLDSKKLLIKGVDSSAYGYLGSKYRFETNEPLDIEITDADVDGPTEFTIKSNDGSTLVYSAMNLIPSATDNGRLGRPAAAWPLSKKIDAAGNEINFEYESNSPSSLSYRLKNVVYANGLNNIEFNYEDRPDSQIGYAGGFQFNVSKRLKSVISYVDSQELRTYSLEYIQSSTSNRSLLQSIEASRGSSYLPKTVFDWKQGSFNYSPELKYSNNENSSYHNNRVQGLLPYLLLDMNGDGKLDYWKIRAVSNSQYDDIIFITGGDNFEQYAYFNGKASFEFRTSAEVIDVDNDGRDDVIFNQGGQWHIYHSVLDAAQPDKIDYNMGNPPIRTNVEVLNRNIKIADFNSDGYADISYVHNGEIYVHYNTYLIHGLGTFATPVKFLIPELAQAHTKFPDFVNNYDLNDFLKVVDIDNDGVNEFLVPIVDAEIYRGKTFIGYSGQWLLASKNRDGEIAKKFFWGNIIQRIIKTIDL